MAETPTRSHLLKVQCLRSWDFGSLTLYDAEHFFHPNELNRYWLGTKNKTLKYNGDGSLTLYAGAKSAWPGEREQLATGTDR